MTVVPIRTTDLAARVRAEAFNTPRQAMILVLELGDDPRAESVATELGISASTLTRARRVARLDPAAAARVRAGEVALSTADDLVRIRAERASIGSAAIASLAREIAGQTTQDSRRAMAVALAEHDRGLAEGDVNAIRKAAGVTTSALARARRAVMNDPLVVRRALAGGGSLNAAANRPATAVESVRVDAAWVGREVARKLEGALDALAELPHPSDVADLLKAHSALTGERLDRAITWLGGLRDAIR